MQIGENTLQRERERESKRWRKTAEMHKEPNLTHVKMHKPQGKEAAPERATEENNVGKGK